MFAASNTTPHSGAIFGEQRATQRHTPDECNVTPAQDHITPDGVSPPLPPNYKRIQLLTELRPAIRPNQRARRMIVLAGRTRGDLPGDE